MRSYLTAFGRFGLGAGGMLVWRCGDSGGCDNESGIYVVWSDHVGVEGAESAKVD